MNETLGPGGLVPSALMFGEFTQISVAPEQRPSRSKMAERAEIAHLACREMKSQIAGSKMRCALPHALTPSSDRSYQPGDKVLQWRGKKSTTG